MRLLVIGATGRTGRLVVERALGHGHDVTAFAHSRPLGLKHPSLTVIEGDALDFGTVAAAVSGNSAVAVTVGDSSAKNFHEPLVANVIHAMAEQGASRLAVLSAAGTFARSAPGLGLTFRALIATTMRSTYDDLEAMELRVMASDLDWTIVRPVGLTDDPPTGHYRVSRDGTIPPKVSRISRSDVAAVILKALETDTYWRKTVVVAQ